MDELVKRVSDKTGLAEDQARQVIGVVIDFVKEKLPAPIAGQVDSLLQGGGSVAGGLGDMAKKGLGGLLG